MKKRWMAGRGLLCLVVAATVALTGCSKAADVKESGTDAVKTAEPAGSVAPAKTDEPVTTAGPAIELNWMNFPGAIQEDSYGQKLLESKFAVKFKAVYPIAYGDFVQKQQIQLATNDIPDVLFVNNPGDINKYATQGLLAEIPLSMIEQYAPRTKANLDKQAPQGWYYSNVNGKNFGVPTFYFSGQFTTKQLWRTDLLKKVGIEKTPETIDEFTTAFAALKKIGVYGMSSNGQSFYNAFHTMFGAYGVMPTQWMVKDGKVVNGAIQPEAKEALTKLAEWYKAGYIDPDFISGKDIPAKFNSGKLAFMDSANVTSTDEKDANSVINAVKKVDPNGSIAFGPLPKGPKGLTGGWSWGTAGNIWAFGKQMEKSPEKMQKALQILDALQNDDETWLALAWGEKGKHWEPKDAAKGIDGGMKRLDPYNDLNKLQAEGIADLGNGTTFWGAQANLDVMSKYADKSLLAASQLYNKPIADIFGKSDILPTSGKYWGDMIKLKTETYARIILGELPLTAFDDFVKQWNEKGGTQLEKEANEAYSSIKK